MHIDGSGESFGCPAANDEQLEIAWDAIDRAGPDFRKAGLAVSRRILCSSGATLTDCAARALQQPEAGKTGTYASTNLAILSRTRDS